MPKMSSGSDLQPGAPLPADFFDQEEESVSLFGVANLFLRHIRILLGLPILAFTVVLLVSYLGEETYSATSSFMPANADGMGSDTRGGSLIAQLGQLVSGGDGASPRFYAGLLTSSALTREAARDTYEITVEGETRRGTVAELNGLEPLTPEHDLRLSQGLIMQNVTASMSQGTGFVVLETRSEWPELAVAINRRLLELVNQFNVEQRQSQAATERVFVEERLEEAAANLAQAEQELMRFFENNQAFEQSPRLRFDADRLQRQVAFRQQLYTQLAQAHEQAKISEVRNTPVTTVVEQPEANIRRLRGRSALFNGLLAAVVALLLAAGYVLVLAYLGRHSKEHSEDYAEFRALVGSMIPARGARLRSRLGLDPPLHGNGRRGEEPPAERSGSAEDLEAQRAELDPVAER